MTMTNMKMDGTKLVDVGNGGGPKSRDHNTTKKRVRLQIDDKVEIFASDN